jgi:hypothetical protein
MLVALIAVACSGKTTSTAGPNGELPDGAFESSAGSGGEAGAASDASLERDAGPDVVAEAAQPDVGSSCSDGVQDGDETDVDCGGSCAPCPNGDHCSQPKDCSGAACVNGACCAAATYKKTSGAGSGTITVCCNTGDIRIDYDDCGIGANHEASPTDPNCATGEEGAGNGGTCCADVVCQKASCGP